ncbi:MAG: hypothetical protein U0797_02820 [Gemmataceae bacterium]
MLRPVSLAIRLALATVVVTLSACGGKKFPTTYPVKGKILVNGQPAKECQITLQPTMTTGDPATQAVPRGITDEKGEFQLTSFKANDGAPEGEYVVTIEWRDRAGISQALEGPDQLGGAYAKMDKNRGLKGFAVQVGKQPLDLPPFELTQTAEAKRQYEAKKKPPGPRRR